jgi:hypothetical protein
MQMVKNIFITFIVFCFAFLVFMPKQELYFTLEKELAKQDIEINEESLKESVFGLTAKNVTFYFKGIKVATAQEIDIYTLFFYSRAKVIALKVDESLRALVPQEIENTRFVHSMLSPFIVRIKIRGTFGSAEGTMNLKTRKVHIDFTDTKNIVSIRSQLKKDEEGWYYETSF